MTQYSPKIYYMSATYYWSIWRHPYNQDTRMIRIDRLNTWSKSNVSKRCGLTKTHLGELVESLGTACYHCKTLQSNPQNPNYGGILTY